MKKRKLNKAKKDKRDEFYTQYCDVENELKHYKEHFKGKVVYCNCDNVNSNFVKYFKDNFKELGIKKLIHSWYNRDAGTLAMMWNYSWGNKESALHKWQHTSKIEYIGDEIICTNLKGNGDFRSRECIEILKQADIVVTNPPFSLFREYVQQLVEYGKDFLILGNLNAITYKDCFKLIKENKMWLGVSIHAGDVEFMVPSHYGIIGKISRIDEKGNKYVRVTGIRWYTNLDHNIIPPHIILTKKYNPKDYPKYDNYDAINVDKTKDIPMDYKGVMGVPITFLDKYNPEQFEIVKFGKGDDDKDLIINGKCPYFRILIKHKKL